jgi:Flp pilus assembly pilin Flp
MTIAVRRFIRDCSGATMVEYAIIASVISIALAAAGTLIGSSLNGMLGAVSDHLK